MNKIPIAYPCFGNEEEQAACEVIRSGWVSQGLKVSEFEKKVAEYCGCRFARAVNSGSNAIYLALLACDVQPEDEIIVPAFTCVAAINPIEHIGAVPVPVDIQLPGFGLDVGLTSKAITKRTKAIMVTHLFGASAEIQPLMALAKKYNLKLIEDAALGLGTFLDGKHVGTFGDCGILSFHPRKLITTGEGGIVLCNDDNISLKVERLRNYGASKSAIERHKDKLYNLPCYKEPGFNFKLTDIQAAIGVVQMNKLPSIMTARKNIAERYTEALAKLDWIETPGEVNGQRHAWESYVCLFREQDVEKAEKIRKRLFRHLSENNVVSLQGAQALHHINYLTRKYSFQSGSFPNSDRADRNSFCLPIFPDLARSDQEHVIKSVLSFKYSD